MNQAEEGKSFYPTELLVGDMLTFNSRECVVVGFEEDQALLESVFRDEKTGKPTSKWKVDTSFLLRTRPITRNE